MPPGSRQQSGSACEECRKRKLRCDRQQPQCGTCVETGIDCKTTTSRSPRGPKKGDLKGLRGRIAALERRFVERPRGLLPGEPYVDLMEEELASISVSDEAQPQFSSGKHSDGGIPSPLSDAFTKSHQSHQSGGSSRGTLIPELMRADLDQLYFDRVHPIVPVLHQYRYFSWAKQSPPNDYRLCLQYAMWTLAMSLSTQFEEVRDKLYTETRQMLEALDLRENDMTMTHVEQVQAWLLISLYEFLRTDYRRGWISAGRVFRLVQLFRLHEIDSPKNKIGQANTINNEDWIAIEEKRRTFWVAYTLDRFVSVRNGWPLTLNEEIICTRLPVQEAEFQNSQSLGQVCFLSEAIASNDHSLFSPLAECAILVTICGRALSHNEVSIVEQVYGNASQDFWIRHEWLDSMLTRGIESLPLNYPVSVIADPMLLFTIMVAHTTVIYLCKIMESLAWEAGRYETAISDYQKRALWAAREIARLSKEHEHIGYFKAHIFMPVAIFLGAERMITHRDAHSSDRPASEDEALDPELQWLFDILRSMQSVNNLAKYHLQILESGAFRGTMSTPGL